VKKFSTFEFTGSKWNWKITVLTFNGIYRCNTVCALSDRRFLSKCAGSQRL